MAYAATLSLKQTIERLSKSSRISIVQNSSPEIAKSLYDEVCYLQKVLKKLDSSSTTINRKTVNALDAEIRVAICKLEDSIESHLKNQSEEEKEIFSIDLEKLNQQIDSFTQTLREKEKEYLLEIQTDLVKEEEEEEEAAESEEEKNDGKNMVGLSDQYTKIKDQLITLPKGLYSLLGMAGIGKTTLAKKLFHDSSISVHFDKRVFVTLGPKYQYRRVLLDILEQVISDTERVSYYERFADEYLKRMLQRCLKCRKYLIVLDDVWRREHLDQLVDSFPNYYHIAHILLTTRLQRVAAVGEWRYEIRFLDKNESWELLQSKVFDEMSCPTWLEKAGKKIAEKCEGLALTIVTVAKILSKSEKTAEYWDMVAADEKQNSFFMDAYDQMYKVLYPSYDYLDQSFKPCFLYMGVFPQKCVIPRSKLFNLWIAEGFLESEYYSANRFFENLVSNSLVMETFNLPSPFWYLCNKEAANNKFFCALNGFTDDLADIESQHRLCIRDNILFGIKEVYDSVASISKVRSLLCTGPYHQYPVSMFLEYTRFLRILDALTIRFYEFPMEVVDLLQLIYLSITYNGKIPTSIYTKLWDLEYLIVQPHLRIINSVENTSQLPTEIWAMQKLKHLQVMGSDLPHPHSETSLLPNLLTLLDVSPQTCTKDILERTPKLQELGVRIELAPDNDEPLCLFDNISHLHNLVILECTIVNPEMVSFEVVRAPPVPLSILPSGLLDLTLSGFGYSWEEISKIALLPHLTRLKLQCFTFRGPKWEVLQRDFPQLELLVIEDSDLVHWTVQSDYALPMLHSLSVKYCFKLEEIPIEFGRSLRRMELVDCNRLAQACAEKIKEDVREKYGDFFPLDLTIESSWDD
ncbi:hypothetical protein ABFS83_04G150500 [Erythranthe nasuta]